MTLVRPEMSKSGPALAADEPIVEDSYERERLFSGREFEDDPRAAPPRSFIRLPAPELCHTAGGTSAASCADAGDTAAMSRPEKRKYVKRPTPSDDDIRRLFNAGATQRSISQQLGIPTGSVSAILIRLGLSRGKLVRNREAQAWREP